MNKQRKVVITTTYNELGIIIDTKAEEVAQPNLQQTCNRLATDCISRQAAIDAICKEGTRLERNGTVAMCEIKQWCVDLLERLPSAQFEIIRCKDCKKAPKCYGDVLMKSKGGGYIYCPVEYCSEAERRTDGQTD